MGPATVLKSPIARERPTLFGLLMQAAEHGRLPDQVVRFGIRRLLRTRLRAVQSSRDANTVDEFVNMTRSQPIAVATGRANEQHYEVPTGFYQHVLGPALKYSSCYWSTGASTLESAENESLRLTCRHADLGDGMDILELGCGWGALSLWMAQMYPLSSIVAVSNSQTQRAFIEAQATERRLNNLTVVTSDMNDFHPSGRFDRVVSVEMFEHMRNHHELMTRIYGWLKPTGRLLVHHFCHRYSPYLFETEGDHNWMGQYFFSGGMMPSRDLLQRCGSPLQSEHQWDWNGRHYARTCRAWLNNQDAAAERLRPVLARTCKESEVTRWHQRWRMFFMACEELFAFNQGKEWFVTHALFRR